VRHCLRTLVWDGEDAIERAGLVGTELTGCEGFHEVQGTKVVLLKPAEPEHNRHRNGDASTGRTMHATRIQCIGLAGPAARGGWHR
jgi:hypothetical protein